MPGRSRFGIHDPEIALKRIGAVTMHKRSAANHQGVVTHGQFLGGVAAWKPCIQTSHAHHAADAHENDEQYPARLTTNTATNTFVSRERRSGGTDGARTKIGLR